MLTLLVGCKACKNWITYNYNAIGCMIKFVLNQNIFGYLAIAIGDADAKLQSKFEGTQFFVSSFLWCIAPSYYVTLIYGTHCENDWKRRNLCRESTKESVTACPPEPPSGR